MTHLNFIFKYSLLFIILVGVDSNGFSQNNYSMSWGNSGYDTLTNTTRMYDPVETEIKFGFDFPFFNTLYSSVIIDIDGVGYFPSSKEYNLFLWAGNHWPFSNGASKYFSAWRYGQDTVNGLNVLKVEWRNVGISAELTKNKPVDHKINYQAWFYENGVIELHFGDIELSKTIYYTDTTGFTFKGGGTMGPWVGIGNPDLSDVYYISGTKSNFKVVNVEDSTDTFFGIPDIGWYVRWTPKKPNALSEFKNTNEAENIMLYPNPTNDYFNIKFSNELSENTNLYIYNSSQQLVISYGLKDINEKVDISELPSGVYIIRISNDNMETVKRIMKY